MTHRWTVKVKSNEYFFVQSRIAFSFSRRLDKQKIDLLSRKNRPPYIGYSEGIPTKDKWLFLQGLLVSGGPHCHLQKNHLFIRADQNWWSVHSDLVFHVSQASSHEKKSMRPIRSFDVIWKKEVMTLWTTFIHHIQYAVIRAKTSMKFQIFIMAKEHKMGRIRPKRSKPRWNSKDCGWGECVTHTVESYYCKMRMPASFMKKYKPEYKVKAPMYMAYCI